MLQSLGLSSDAWFNTAEASDGAVLSLTNPGDVMLGIGMLTILAGTLVGLFGQAPQTVAGLRPAILPPVLLAVLSIGSMAFAYQVGGFDSTDVPGSPSVASAQECPDGFFWHPVMNHCMADGTEAVTPVATDQNTGTPVCPDGYYWHQVMNHCMENGTTAVTPVDDDGDPSTTPVCPDGYYWHSVMNHCMANGTSAVTPVATDQDTGTPVCPDGYYWMPSMSHCMSETPATPVPPGEPTPVCPPGYYWMPSMNHCMPNVSTPPPTGTPGAPAPTPECPPGFYWMPEMNHCMPNGTPTPPPTGTPTSPPTGTPSCPEGYVWMPEMGHCMSTTCPPPWVFNWDTLYCELPEPEGPTISMVSPTEGGQADTELTVEVQVSGATLDLASASGAHWHITLDGVSQAGAYDGTTASLDLLSQGPHTIEVALYQNEADSVVVASDEASFIALDDPDICQEGSVYSTDGHCDLYTCPPPWFFDWVDLHCDLPDDLPTETPTETPPPPTPTPEPTPSCPDGYIWMPAMGHCMSTTCPPPWVFNWDTLYCELPPDISGSTVSSAVIGRFWRPSGYFWS